MNLEENDNMISSIKDFTLLNNGLKMPWLGFGVLNIEDGQVGLSSIGIRIENALYNAWQNRPKC